jgi:3'-5' exoribonuclease
MRKDILPNERITTFFALESMELRQSRNLRHFLVLNLHDKTGGIRGYLWNEPVESATLLKEKSFVKVRGITKILNGSLAIEIEKIRMAEKHEVDLKDFLEIVPGGIDYWHRKLLEQISLIKDSSCKKLVDSFLEDTVFLENFLSTPGGISVHHNYIGGLLEHTVNTMCQAAFIADMHPGLIDKDMLLTGAFLHDIGKTREMHYEIAREYTTEGKLLGHVTLGFSMVNEKISRLDSFPEELAMLLKHMILSHHGELEHGSPVRPATPEALMLHLIENMDAKLNHLYCHLKHSNPENPWSPYDRYLNTEIYQKKHKKTHQREIVEVGI